MAWEALLSPDVSGDSKAAFKELLPVYDIDHVVYGRKFGIIHKACLGLDSTITSLDALASLLRDSRPQINLADATGRTALHWVAKKGDVQVAEALLRCGADPNVVDSDFWTPLHFAVQSGSVETVASLVSAGAALHIKNRWGETALHINWPDIADHPRLAEVMMVGLRGNRLDTTDRLGQTPLHVAASHGNVGVLKIFLDRGAEIEARRTDGYSALALAVSWNMTAAAKFLLRSGAQSHVVNNHGHTLLHIVAMHGTIPVMKSMRGKLTVDVHAVDKDDKTAMDLLYKRFKDEKVDEEMATELAKVFRLLANSA
jgi:ankyrin repeat protein